MVYPAAMHTRFEHSLGVMHVATRLFDTLRRRDGETLRSEYKFEEVGLDRQRQIIRLAALLHDVGHGPFSHAAEEVLPRKKDSEHRHEHEEYSAAIVRYILRDVIEDHPINYMNYKIQISDLESIFSQTPTTPNTLMWKNLVSGQMDADRMDYLLRDSFHAGVSYGRYDLDRLSSTVTLCQSSESESHEIGVSEDGIHAVEGLLIARYMMFTQLYYHKTRTIYDYHLVECLKELLKEQDGVFPPPTEDGIKSFIQWDDWKVLGRISEQQGGRHGDILRDRSHFRNVYETPEIANAAEIKKVEKLFKSLESLNVVMRPARKSWYKFENEEIVIKQSSSRRPKSVPLSAISPVVEGLKTVNQMRLYVPKENREKALGIIKK